MAHSHEGTLEKMKGGPLVQGDVFPDARDGSTLVIGKDGTWDWWWCGGSVPPEFAKKYLRFYDIIPVAFPDWYSYGGNILKLCWED